MTGNISLGVSKVYGKVVMRGRFYGTRVGPTILEIKRLSIFIDRAIINFVLLMDIVLIIWPIKGILSLILSHQACAAREGAIGKKYELYIFYKLPFFINCSFLYKFKLSSFL